ALAQKAPAQVRSDAKTQERGQGGQKAQACAKALDRCDPERRRSGGGWTCGQGQKRQGMPGGAVPHGRAPPGGDARTTSLRTSARRLGTSIRRAPAVSPLAPMGTTERTRSTKSAAQTV